MFRNCVSTDHKYQMSRPRLVCFCSYLVLCDGFSVCSLFTHCPPSSDNWSPAKLMWHSVYFPHPSSRPLQLFCTNVWPFCNLDDKSLEIRFYFQRAPGEWYQLSWILYSALRRQITSFEEAAVTSYPSPTQLLLPQGCESPIYEHFPRLNGNL